MGHVIEQFHWGQSHVLLCNALLNWHNTTPLIALEAQPSLPYVLTRQIGQPITLVAASEPPRSSTSYSHSQQEACGKTWPSLPLVKLGVKMEQLPDDNAYSAANACVTNLRTLQWIRASGLCTFTCNGLSHAYLVKLYNRGPDATIAGKGQEVHKLQGHHLRLVCYHTT